MAISYTGNIHLGLQLDKTDYVSWDTITANWRKIDAAVAGVEYIGDSTVINSGEVNNTIGNAVFQEVE